MPTVPPMPPETMPQGAPAGAPPPGGPPPGAGAPTSPDDVMATQEQAAAAQRDAIMSMAPVPAEAIPVRDVERLVEEINGVLSAVNKKLPEGFEPIRPIEWTPTKGEKTWSAAIPGEVWVPLATLAAMAVQVEGGKFAEKHGFDPTKLTTPDEYKVAAAKLRNMAKDDKFIDAVTQGAFGGGGAVEGAPAPAPPAPSPEQAGGQDIMAEAAM